MILIVGTKGGVGTTTMALMLVRALRGVGLDAADGSLAGRLDRPVLALSHAALLPRAAFLDTVDHVVQRRTTLLWTPECPLLADRVREFIRAVNERTEVVADCGIEPPQELSANDRARTVIVSIPDHSVAAYHERQLMHRFPGAYVVYGAGKEQMNEVLQNLR